MKSAEERGQAAMMIGAGGIILLLAAVCLGVTCVNIRFAGQNPGGSDFLVAWEGMRSVLGGESPYSDATAGRIQQRFYGRPALPGENELRVPYPIYMLLFLAPLNLTADYATARGIWMTALELATMGFALSGIAVSGREWTRWQKVVFLMFSLLWYFGLRAVINGNVVILVAFFLGAALFCLQKKWEWAAGILLACTTFKPQVALFPIGCVLIWLLMQRRFRPIIAFGAALLMFIAIGWVILPTWIAENWREVQRYAAYDFPGNPESSLRPMLGLAGSWIGIAVSIAASAGIGLLWLRLRKADRNNFLEIILMTLILAPLSGMQTDPGNQYILLLPVACFLFRSQGSDPGSRIRFIAVLTLIGFGLWGLFLMTIQHRDQPMQHPGMLFPLPLFLLGLWLWDRRPLRRQAAAVS